MRLNSLKPIGAAALIAFLPLSAAEAEGRVSYTAEAGKMGEMRMTDRWTADALRTDIEGMDAYSILKGDEVFSVIAMGGQITVMPITDLAGMGNAGGAEMQQQTTGMVVPESIDAMRDTGETRQVAGIEGAVFEVDWTDAQGRTHEDTAVLSDDPTLLEHQARRITFAEAASGKPANPFLTEMAARGLAPLSFGDRFQVLEVSEDPGPEGNFILPAEPMDLEGMMNMGQQ